MKIHSKYIWLVAAIAAAVVLGFALQLWHRSGNVHQQAHITPSPTNKAFSHEMPQAIPEPKSNLPSNRRPVSSESAVTSSPTKSSEKQRELIEMWKRLLQEEPDRDSIRRFIVSLSDDQLLELMEYFCSSKQLPLVEALVIPTLKQRWGRDVPFEQLLDLAVNGERNDLFRTILVDIITVTAKDAQLVERDAIASRLMQIAIDRTEDGNFRERVIKYLSGMLQHGVSEENTYSDTFLKILTNASEDPRVVAASTTALRRLEDNRAVPVLMETCLNYGSESNTCMARHAVVTLAKYHMKHDTESPLHAIRHVLKTTQDDRLYGSSVYAISLLTNTDVLEALPDMVNSVDARGQSGKDSLVSALCKHKQAVLDALGNHDHKYVIAALKACALVPVPEAKDMLNKLATEFPEHSLLIVRALEKADLRENSVPEWKREIRKEKDHVD